MILTALGNVLDLFFFQRIKTTKTKHNRNFGNIELQRKSISK